MNRTWIRRNRGRRVRSVEWKRSTMTGKSFRVGYVTIKKARVQVFDFDGGGHWIRANEGQFV